MQSDGYFEVCKEPFSISTNPTLIDLPLVHQFLSEQSYWAKHVPFETVKASIEGSLCFSVFNHDDQVGFARVITDKATFGYLADVFILPEFRGQGLSKWLMESILAHPDLQGFRRFLLATADAQGLYAQFGFKPLAKPERWMEIHNPGVYSG